MKLLLSASMDAVLEATRVFGNLSQSKDVRDVIMQHKGETDARRSGLQSVSTRLSRLCLFLPSPPSSVLPPPSAPVGGDVTGLKQRRDVLLRLRRPHKPVSGPPGPAQAVRGGRRRQVSIVSQLIGVEETAWRRGDDLFLF